MKIRFSILWISIFLSFQSIAQNSKPANNWYFGDGVGITFNSGSPQVINDCAANLPYTCSSISDTNGNLLFYTNGFYVWNRNHTQMPWGHGISGCEEAAQPALIVPDPGNPAKYYIFTTSTISCSLNRMYYSIVDMTKDSGKGDLIDKNILMGAWFTGRQTAVKHRNNKDYWLMGTNSLYDVHDTWLIDSDFINGSDVVILNVGKKIVAGGCSKFSPDGSRLAHASGNSVEILDFDNATGVVSNPLNSDYYLGQAPYGVEFSPDNRKVYTLTGNDSLPNKLWQIDFCNSKVYLISSNISVGGSLQLGPDHKIYVAENDYLGVINNPNGDSSQCNYVPKSLYLNGRTCKKFLPAFVQSLFYTPGATDTSLTVSANSPLCEGDTLRLSSEKFPGARYHWSGPNDYLSSVTDPVKADIKLMDSGIYSVSVDVDLCKTKKSSINVQVHPKPIPFLGEDSIICDSSLVILNPGNFNDYYWQDSSTNPSLEVRIPGKYAVIVENEFGCRNSDSIVFTDNFCNTKIYIPNAFSPNGDGINDVFEPVAKDATEYEFRIYNRWGQKIFESNSLSVGWDGHYLGNFCPDGIYFWTISIRFGNNSKTASYSGKVTLLK